MRLRHTVDEIKAQGPPVERRPLVRCPHCGYGPMGKLHRMYGTRRAAWCCAGCGRFWRADLSESPFREWGDA